MMERDPQVSIKKVLRALLLTNPDLGTVTVRQKNSGMAQSFTVQRTRGGQPFLWQLYMVNHSKFEGLGTVVSHLPR